MGLNEQVYREIGANAAPALLILKLTAQYLTAAEGTAEMVFTSLSEILADASAFEDLSVRLNAALLYTAAGNFKEALKLVHNGETLEMYRMALTVQIYLRINRADLAEKQYKAMHDVDDDDTLTLLCSAWVGLALGGEQRLQDAYTTLQGLVEQFNNTVQLANQLAACSMAAGKLPEALEILKEARELASSSGQPTSPDTLINSIVTLTQLGKSDAVAKQLIELQALAPKHAWLDNITQMETFFDKSAANYVA